MSDTPPPFAWNSTPQPPRRWSGFLVLSSGIILTLLLLCGGLAVVPLKYFSGTAASPAEPDSEFVRQALSSQRVGMGKRDLRGIEKTFDSIVNVVPHSNVDAFASVVDHDRFFDCATGYPEFLDQTFFSSASVRLQVSDHLYIPLDFDRYHIVYVQRLEDRNEAKVLTYCWNGEYAFPIVWWMIQRHNQWMIYDWNVVSYGRRASQDYIQRVTLADHHYELSRLDAWGWSAKENPHAPQAVAEANELLNAIEADRFPDAFREDALLRIATTMLGFQQQQFSERALALSKDRASAPGGYLTEAHLYESRGDYLSALKALEQYEALLGLGPDVGPQKARVLVQLGRKEAAAHVWGAMLRFMPENLQVLQNVLSDSHGAPPEEFEKALLRNSQLSETLLFQLANYQRTTESVENLGWLADFAARRLPKSSVAESLAGLAAESAGDYEQASPLLKSAAQRSRLGAGNTGFDYASHFYASFAIDAEDYTEALDFGATFEQLIEEFRTRRMRIDQLSDAAEYFQQRNSDSVEAVQVLTSLDLLHGNVDAALNRLANALGKGTVEKSLIDRWAEIQVYAGRTSDAYLNHPNNPLLTSSFTFQNLAKHCERAGEFRPLSELIEVHRQNTSTDPWLIFYRAIVDHAGGRTEEVKRALDELQRLSIDGDALLLAKVNDLRIEQLWNSSKIDEARQLLQRDQQLLRGWFHNSTAHHDWDRAHALAPLFHEQPLQQPLSLAVMQQDDEELIRLWESRQPGSIAEWFTQYYEDLYAAAVLRAGRLEQARLHAKERLQRNQPLSAVCLAIYEGDVEGTLELARRPQGKYFVAIAYGKPWLATQLWSDEFATVRAEFPPPLSAAALSSVIGLRTTAPLAAFAEIDESVRRAFGPEAEFGPWIDLGSRRTMLVSQADSRYLVTVSNQACDTIPLSMDGEGENYEMTVPIAHGGWIAIDTMLGSDVTTDSRRILRELLTTDCVGIYLPDAERWIDIESAYRNLPTEWNGDLLRLRGRVSEIKPLAAPRLPTRRLQSLRRRLRDSSELESVSVAVERSCGSALEVLQAVVVSYDRDSKLSIRLQEPTRLFPIRSAGETFAVDIDDVLDFTITAVNPKPQESSIAP